MGQAGGRGPWATREGKGYGDLFLFISLDRLDLSEIQVKGKAKKAGLYNCNPSTYQAEVGGEFSHKVRTYLKTKQNRRSGNRLWRCTP